MAKYLSLRDIYTLLFLFLINDLYAQQILTSRGEVQIYTPDGYSESKRYPLLLLLHGYGFDGETAERIWGFTESIDKYGFIYINPSGTTDQAQSPFWNATPACCNFYNSTADDISFLFELIQETKTKFTIDDNHIYVVGDSNGGFMALEFAYQFPELVAAVVSSAGASHFNSRNPLDKGVHILQIHGTEDISILYEGGTIQGEIYPGAIATATQWAKYNECSTTDIDISYQDFFPSLPDLETKVMLFNSGCLEEGSTELWTIVGGGHGFGRPVTTSNRVRIINWLYSKTKSGWPAKYNGITPPNHSQLELNNIGYYNINDGIIYSCLRVLQNGETSTIDGVEQFAIGFEISSTAEGKIRAVKSRQFNPTNALTKYNERPDCSGSFEMNTGIYSDIILLEENIFEAAFELTNTKSLELNLISIRRIPY